MGCTCTREQINRNIKYPTKYISKYSHNSSKISEKYVYICMIGQGGFSKVRLYHDKDDKHLKYAIKTIKKNDLDYYITNLLIEEISILRELDHPQIVKYYESYEDECFLNVVMEYLQGEDLFKLISNKKYHEYTELDVVEIIRNLLSALQFIHKKNIVHRDLKPENILFSKPGDYTSLKLIDFGLSTHSALKNKSVVGTTDYMAPELFNGESSEKSDIWSVGVLIFTLIIGKLPFNGYDKEDVINNIRHANYDKKFLAGFKCSNYAKDLITSILVVDPLKRPTIKEIFDHPWFKIFGDKKFNKKKSCDHILESHIIDSIVKFSHYNSFKKEVLFYIAKLSKDEEIAKLKKSFKHFDTESKGTLSIENIITAFNDNNIEVNKVIFFYFRKKFKKSSTNFIFIMKQKLITQSF